MTISPIEPAGSSAERWLALLSAASAHTTDRLNDSATWDDLGRAIRENQIPLDRELLDLARPEIQAVCRLIIPGIIADFLCEHRDEIRAAIK